MFENDPASPRRVSEGVALRFARRRDIDELAALIAALNVHQGDPVDLMDRAALARDGFDEPQFSIIVAERAARLVGYALYFESYETGYAARGYYLCDLFVAEEARGLNIGRRLIAALAAEAKRRGKSYIWWASKEWNRGAQRFYEKLGAISETVTAHALVFDQFEALADEGRDLIQIAIAEDAPSS